MAKKERKTSPNIPKPEYAYLSPDGGWGWVIVVAALYCNFVIDGIVYSSGVFIGEISKDMNVAPAEVSFVWSLMFGFHFLSGPISGGLIQTIGIRPTALIGVLLTTFVMTLPMFPLPFWALAVCLGVFGGAGMCFIFMATITITILYFTTYRVHALGIMNCGTGLGTIVFSYVCTYLVQNMSWRWAHMVLAGFSAVMLLSVYTFRPLRPARVEVTDKVAPGSLFQSKLSLSELPEDGEDDDIMDGELYRIKLIRYNSQESLESCVSAMQLTRRALDQILTDVHHHHFLPGRLCRCCPNWCHCRGNSTTTLIRMHPQTKRTLLDRKRTIQTIGTVPNVSFYGSLEVIPRPIKQPHHAKMSKFLKQVFDFRLLRDTMFLFFCISSALTSAAIMIMFTYEKDRIQAEGHSTSQGASYIALLGASNMFWRLVLGFLSNMTCISYKALYAVSMILAGAAIILSSYITSVYFHIFFCVAFGLAHACFAVYRPAMLVDFAGVENVANSSGISLMVMGVITIPAPPLTGWITHIYGGYEIAFVICGGLFILSAIPIMPYVFNKTKSEVIAPPTAGHA